MAEELGGYPPPPVFDKVADLPPVVMIQGEPIVTTLSDLIKWVLRSTTDAPEGEGVDVFFFRVGFTKEADVTPEEFVATLAVNEHGEFCDITLDRWREGPSYIEVGGWIGDQGLAMRFMALGEHVGVWTVVTPRTLGIDGPDAAKLAGGGMVMVAPKEALTAPSKESS